METPPPSPPAREDETLARRLVETGRLSRDVLEPVLLEQQVRGGSDRIRLAPLLVERGLLLAAEVPATARPPSGRTVTPPTARPTASSGTLPLLAPGLPETPVHRPLTPEENAALSDPARRIGRYAIVSELGRGAMGVVHRAIDSRTRSVVAIKTILDPARANEEEVRRFRVEAAAATRLHHPTIVASHEVGEHEGKPYLVMELIEGSSLERLLKEPLPPKWIAQLIRGIALALDHAHKNGVVHRDVKPENVIVDRAGQPRLTDFGLARDASQNSTTRSGSVIGTPAYMAPEMAGEAKDQGPHSDVYSLGAVLYRALVGRPPFEASSFAAIMKQLLFEPPVPPRQIKPDLPPELETLVLRCLEKEPEKRPTAAQVAAELGRFLALDSSVIDIPEGVLPAVDEEGEPLDSDLRIAALVPEAESKPAAGTATGRKRRASESEDETGSRRRARRSKRRSAEDPDARQEKQNVQLVLAILIPLGLLLLAIFAFVTSR